MKIDRSSSSINIMEAQDKPAPEATEQMTSMGVGDSKIISNRSSNKKRWRSC